MSEWFVEKRGLANGVINAGECAYCVARRNIQLFTVTGTAVGGLFLPLILPTLLEKYGSARTLRGLSVAEALLLCFSLPFIKGRLPEARVHGPGPRSNGNRHFLTAFREPRLLFVLCANTMQGLAYFVPMLWLPSAFLSGDDATIVLTIAYDDSICVFPQSESHGLFAFPGLLEWRLGSWSTEPRSAV